MDKKISFGVGLLALVVFLILWAIAPSVIAGTWYLLRAAWPWLLVFILVIGGWVLSESTDGGGCFVAIFLGIVAIILGVLAINRSYYKGRALLATVPVVQQTMEEPGYEKRFVHYDNGVKSLIQELGDLQGVTVSNGTYIGDENGTRWTVIADGGSLRPLKGVVAYYDDGTFDTCQMSGPAITGIFNNKIANRIRRQALFVDYVPSDIYGDCVDGEGRIYIPLIRYRGFNNVPYPAGLAVMDRYGNVVVYTNSLPEGVTGPVYPESIAKAQEQALDTAGGWWNWITGAYGYEETNDSADPNSENSGQYNLRKFGLTTHYYVTPLTAKGSGLSFVGQVEIPADTVIFGQLNTGVFMKYQNPVSGSSTMSDEIKSRFSRNMNWVILKLQEVVPGQGNTWVAYVGQDKILNYIITYDPYGEITYEVITPEGGAIVEQADGYPTETTTECAPLWDELNVAVADKDLARVLSVSAQLVANDCASTKQMFSLSPWKLDP